VGARELGVGGGGEGHLWVVLCQDLVVRDLSFLGYGIWVSEELILLGLGRVVCSQCGDRVCMYSVHMLMKP
jgi:hypothetical protein